MFAWGTGLQPNENLAFRGKRVNLRPGFLMAESNGGGAGDCDFLQCLRLEQCVSRGLLTPWAWTRLPAEVRLQLGPLGAYCQNGMAGWNPLASLGLARCALHSGFPGQRTVRQMLHLLRAPRARPGGRRAKRQGWGAAAEISETRPGRAAGPPRL